MAALPWGSAETHATLCADADFRAKPFVADRQRRIRPTRISATLSCISPNISASAARRVHELGRRDAGHHHCAPLDPLRHRSPSPIRAVHAELRRRLDAVAQVRHHIAIARTVARLGGLAQGLVQLQPRRRLVTAEQDVQVACAPPNGSYSRPTATAPPYPRTGSVAASASPVRTQ